MQPFQIARAEAMSPRVCKGLAPPAPDTAFRTVVRTPFRTQCRTQCRTPWMRATPRAKRRAKERATERAKGRPAIGYGLLAMRCRYRPLSAGGVDHFHDQD